MWATYILGPVLTLLPRRWRERVFRSTPNRVARAAMLSGIAQALLAVAGLVVWYSLYVGYFAEALKSRGAPVEGSRAAGLLGYVWFWFNPVTWVIGYFGLEGLVRSTAALTTGEVYGTLPLAVVEYVYRLATRPRLAPELPLVADEIMRGDATCDLKIASCRARPDWKYPFTLRYAGAYFQVVADIHLGAGPRPYVYSLRRLPPGEIARGLKDYTPDDILTAVQPLQRV